MEEGARPAGRALVMVCAVRLRPQRPRVAGGPVTGAGEPGVSTAVSRLCHQCRPRLVAPGRDTQRPARRRNRRHHPGCRTGGPLMNDSPRQVDPMLPFTRPWIDEDTIEAVAEVLRSGWLASGPKVAQLEAELSSYFGGRPVRTQTSATAGLEMALLACGIGKGDEVITPALSFVATANVIVRVGARPVFVDVGLDSRNIDLEQVAAAITPRTRDRKSTRLNSSHLVISYAVFCLKKKTSTYRLG